MSDVDPVTNDPIASAERQAKAHDLVKRHMVLAAGAGLIPAPLWDIAAVSAVQLRMLKKIAELYPSVRFNAEVGKSAIASLTGGLGATYLGARVLGALRFMPGLGPLLGATAIPFMAAAATYAVGRVFTQHFASDGTLLTFNPDTMKHAYADLYAEGKKKAAEIVSALVR